MPADPSPVYCDFTIVVDTREQYPYHFTGFTADYEQKPRDAKELVVPLIIETERRGLKTGDYSIDGLEDFVTIERKELADLFQTLTWERKRFERELIRMSEMDFAAVVIEASWGSIINGPPRDIAAEDAKKLSKTVYRSVIALQQRFPNVHWWDCPTRSFAERTTFRILERYYRDFKDGLKDVKPVAQVG